MVPNSIQFFKDKMKILILIKNVHNRLYRTRSYLGSKKRIFYLKEILKMISKKLKTTFLKTTRYLNKKSFIIQISIAIDMETFF